MPIYAFKCTSCGGTKDLLMKYEESLKPIPCKSHLDCGGVMEQQLEFSNKPLVADYDLMIARNHNGKK